MNWLRLIGIVTLILSCSAGGLLTGGRLRRRVCELEWARGLLWGLIRRLAYTMAPPEQLIEQLAGQEEGRRCDYLGLALEELARGRPFEPSWREALRRSASALDAGDRELLARAGGILGAFDLETQQSQLSLLTEQIDTRLSQARRQCETGARLASTLGVLLGLGLAVLII